MFSFLHVAGVHRSVQLAHFAALMLMLFGVFFGVLFASWRMLLFPTLAGAMLARAGGKDFFKIYIYVKPISFDTASTSATIQGYAVKETETWHLGGKWEGGTVGYVKRCLPSGSPG